MTGCTPAVQYNSINDHNEDVDIDQEAIDFLVSQYNAFCEIDQALINSSGSGNDVKAYYNAAQVILAEITERQVPSYLLPIKQDLIDGIEMRSDGAGCFSNKSICGSDAAAARLLTEGLNRLNNFRKEISKYQ